VAGGPGGRLLETAPGRDIRREETLLGQCEPAHVVADRSVAAHASLLLVVRSMRESGLLARGQLLVARPATCVRHDDGLAGKLRAAAEVGNHLPHRGCLVRQMRHRPWIDVALHAFHVLVRSDLPGRVERSHLVTAAAESRLIRSTHGSRADRGGGQA